MIFKSRGNLLLLLILILSGCDKTPEIPSDKGSFTLSSRIYGTSVYYVMAYSLENEKEYAFPGNKVDLVAVNNPPPSTGIYLSTTTDNPYGFKLNQSFDTPEEAKNFYTAYTEAEDGPFVQQTEKVIENFQVYTFRTAGGLYVKLLITGLRKVELAGDQTFFEADITYFIQRDGSKNLSE